MDDSDYLDEVGVQMTTSVFNTLAVTIVASSVSISPNSVIGAGPNQINVPYTLSFKLALGVHDETGRVEV